MDKLIKKDTAYIYIYIYIYIYDIMCNQDIQVHELPPSHCSDNQEGKFIYMTHHFILLRFNPFGLRVDREGWCFEHSMS